MAILLSLSEIQKMSKQKNIPPLWISFTIHDDRPNKLRSDEMLETACKTTIQEANALNIQLEAIGVNCSTPSAISNAVPALAKIVEGTNIKVSAYGNCFKTTTSEWISSLDEDVVVKGESKSAGAPFRTHTAEEYDEEGYLLPDAYTKFAREWAESGATIIGGCCGSRPKHMEEVASSLKKPLQ